MKKYINISFIYTMAALACGVFYREFTKLLRDVFITNVELTYDSENPSSENYSGETEQKQWFLNSARFLSWEEWHVGSLAD